MVHLALTKKLSRLGRLGRSFLKRFMYSQMAILTGIKIAIGKEHPLIQFTVEQDPPSVYWVYQIRSSKIEGLEKKLGIPEQFTLCPIQCLDTDEPAYLLVLNAYRVSGLANGIRAEWSVFVRDASDTPRYMVLDARSSTTSVDPVSIVTRASTVVHESIDSTIHTQIGDGDEAFRSTINLPSNAPLMKASAEWVSANDYIYWGNGICDRTFYSAGLANPEQHRIAAENCVIQDDSVWAQFVEPEPMHVLVFKHAIEFVISPWENVDQAVIH